MSGHSKWSKVKHQKATTDVVKAVAFTKASRGIMMAVREGGGITDPEKNFRLRLAIEKARAVNMPKENIARAMEKAAGGAAGDIEPITYEGYGPGGVALLVEAATDNRNRTVSVIKHMFERHGGTLGGPGSVSFLFTRSMGEDGQVMVQPTYRVGVTGQVGEQLSALIHDLEALDDVQRVITNHEV